MFFRPWLLRFSGGLSGLADRVADEGVLVGTSSIRLRGSLSGR